MDIALIGDTRLTLEALVEELKARTDAKGAGERELVEAEIAKFKAD